MTKCEYCGEEVERPCTSAGEMVWHCDNVVWGPVEDDETDTLPSPERGASHGS